MNHPCDHYSCCENYQGECFGEGCRTNPMPEPEYDDSAPLSENGDEEVDN